MANSYLTPDEIGLEALMLVQSEMVASRLMDRNYEGDFTRAKVGETIRIRRRQNGTVNEWSPGALTVNDMVESSISITLEKHFDASVLISSRERQFTIKEFSSQILAPNMLELAESVDAYALTKLRDLPTPARQAVGAAPTAAGALPNSIADMAAVRRTLNDLKVPMQGRTQIVSPEYEEILLGVPEFVKVNESGSSTALRRAELGSLMGFQSFLDQNVDSSEHTAGTETTGGVVAGGGNPIAAGATSLPYDGAAVAAGTFTAGDLINIAGYGYAVVNALVTSSTNAGTLVLREPLRTAVPDDTVFTLFDGTGGTYEGHGAAFHRKAFAFVAPPLERHEHAPESTVVTDPETGLSLRVTFDYDRVEKADVMSIDILVGVKMVDGRLGGQILKGTD